MERFRRGYTSHREYDGWGGNQGVAEGTVVRNVRVEADHSERGGSILSMPIG